ncbi:MAG: serine hydrolase [Reyranellaceae bacterium]
MKSGFSGWRLWRALLAVVVAAGLSAQVLAPVAAEAAGKSKVKAAASKPVAKTASRAKKLQSAKRSDTPASVKADRYAAIILDAQTGRVLHEANADALRYPASLTKAMTLYMTFEAIEQGRLRMDQRLPVSGWAAVQPPTKLDLKEGDTVQVRDLIYSLITKSANDAAVVLAEGLAGDEDVFAQRMTQRAHQLGMRSTTFRNASGLPNEGQTTTASDLAIMALALIRDFPTFYPMFAMQESSYAGRVHTNHNRMLDWYPGAEGLKTGYINASGFNLVLVAKRDGRRLIGVVMGGKSGQARDTHMGELMDRAFADLGANRVAANARVLAALPKPAIAASGLTPLTRVTTASPAPLVPPTFNDLSARKTAPAAKLPPNPFAVASRQSGPTGQGGEPAQYAMQVGAYSDADTARRAVSLARFSLPDLNGNGTIAPLERQGRTLYRARIIGLPEGEAALGCRRLTQNNILDCAVVRIEDDDVDIAAN